MKKAQLCLRKIALRTGRVASRSNNWEEGDVQAD